MVQLLLSYRNDDSFILLKITCTNLSSTFKERDAVLWKLRVEVDSFDDDSFGENYKFVFLV